MQHIANSLKMLDVDIALLSACYVPGSPRRCGQPLRTTCICWLFVFLWLLAVMRRFTEEVVDWAGWGAGLKQEAMASGAHFAVWPQQQQHQRHHQRQHQHEH